MSYDLVSLGQYIKLVGIAKNFPYLHMVNVGQMERGSNLVVYP